MARIIIVTGKGGVGKTSYALSLANSLKDNVEVLYFANEDSPSYLYDEFSQVPIRNLQLVECAQEYMLKKLKSKVLTKVIANSSFFKSLLNIIPGFHFIVYLGTAIEIAEQNSEKTYIIDSPATGHFISLFESTGYFASIVKSGQIFNDLKFIQDKLKDDKFVNVHLITIPERVAFSESRELQKRFKEIHNVDLKLVMNHSFLSNNLVSQSEEKLPQFIQHKLDEEKKLRSSKEAKPVSFIPYFFEANFSSVLTRMTQFLTKSS